jgi:hypothetical protein
MRPGRRWRSRRASRASPRRLCRRLDRVEKVLTDASPSASDTGRRDLVGSTSGAMAATDHESPVGDLCTPVWRASGAPARSDAGAAECVSGHYLWVLPHEYADEAAHRMAADGSAVSQIVLPIGPAVVGYQSQFRLRWMATKLHVFTVVVPVSLATAETLRGATEQSIDYAKQTKGRLRGLQSGVAALPVLVTAQATPDALAAAESRPSKEWAAFTLPAIVDLTSGRIHRFSGRLLWGGLYAAWLRERLNALPSPRPPNERTQVI